MKQKYKKGFTRLVDFDDAISSRAKSASPKFTTGFTLIELLVVVAIIGILASVVLASLNTARAKAADAVIKATMSGIRAQAALYYENQTPNRYSAMCTQGSTGGVYPIVLSAMQKLNSAGTPNTSPNSEYEYSATGATSNASVCHDNTTGWAAITSLKNPTIENGGWCVDSTGASKEVSCMSGSQFTCLDTCS